MIYRAFLSLLLINSIVISASAQQPRPSPSPVPITGTQQPPASEIDLQDVVKISTNLVQVDAVVTKNGKPVTDLQAEDFEISEDGKPQAITNFSYISNVPETGAPKVMVRANPTDKTAPYVPPAKINPNDQRRIVALVVDDLGLSFESIYRVKKQINKFLADVSPNDLIAIIRTGGDVGSLQQFTNDRRVLQRAADHLKWNQCSRAGLAVFAPAGGESANSALCAQPPDQTLRSLRFILRGMNYLPGRKSMVLLTDHLPIQRQEQSEIIKAQNGPETSTQALPDAPSIPENGSTYYAQLQNLAELAIRASVVIYAFDTRGLMTTGLTAADALAAPNPIGSNLSQMQRQAALLQAGRTRAITINREGSDLIAKETGGFLVHDQNNIDLNRIMEDQQGYYLIGFRPHEETFNKNFHHLKVKVKRSGFSVRTREGFYGFTDEQAQPTKLSAADQMNRALLSPFGANDLSVRLSTFFVDDPATGPLLRSFLYFDAQDLTFTEEADGWHAAKIDLRGMVFGDNGRILDQRNQTGTLRFRGEQYNQALRDGIVYGFDLPVKQPGGLQFRVAVRDNGSSHIGAAGQFIDVPNLQKGALALSGIFARSLAGATAPGTSAPLSDAAETILGGPGVRKFKTGSTVLFAYGIYNVNVDNGATLNTLMRIYREGKLIFTGVVRPVSAEVEKDPRHIIAASALQLGSEMEPGEYIVQIIATNTLNQKSQAASQWIDFEVAK